MARRVVLRVAETPPRGRDALVAILARDRGLVLAAFGGALGVRRWIVAPEAMSPAPGAPSTWDVPGLPTSGDLANWLGP
jgi:hypothetical protein